MHWVLLPRTTTVAMIERPSIPKAKIDFSSFLLLFHLKSLNGREGEIVLPAFPKGGRAMPLLKGVLEWGWAVMRNARGGREGEFSSGRGEVAGDANSFNSLSITFEGGGSEGSLDIIFQKAGMLGLEIQCM